MAHASLSPFTSALSAGTNTTNGGWTQYADNVRPKKYFRADDRYTQTGVIASGQVLKAGTFLQNNVDGKLSAHSGMVEKALVTFADELTAKTLIIGGLTFTTTAACPKADLVKAFSNLYAGMTAAQANTLNPVTTGSFTSGTLGAWATIKSSTANAVSFVSTTNQTNVTDLAATGTGTAATVTVIATTIPFNKPIGILLNDVNASSADTKAEYFTEVSMWADAIKWYNDPALDAVTNSDLTTTACTDYYIGGLTYELMKMFVVGTEFSEIGFLSAGEEQVLNRGELR